MEIGRARRHRSCRRRSERAAGPVPCRSGMARPGSAPPRGRGQSPREAACPKTGGDKSPARRPPREGRPLAVRVLSPNGHPVQPKRASARTATVLPSIRERRPADRRGRVSAQGVLAPVPVARAADADGHELGLALRQGRSEHLLRGAHERVGDGLGEACGERAGVSHRGSRGCLNLGRTRPALVRSARNLVHATGYGDGGHGPRGAATGRHRTGYPGASGHCRQDVYGPESDGTRVETWRFCG